MGALKTIRTKRQRETDYDNEEKQLLEISLFDGETTGVWLTFWDSEQIKVRQYSRSRRHPYCLFSLLNNGYQKNTSSSAWACAFVMTSIAKSMD